MNADRELRHTRYGVPLVQELRRLAANDEPVDVGGPQVLGEFLVASSLPRGAQVLAAEAGAEPDGGAPVA